ncbi:hypothetical protein [Nannocystis sp.]|uniref:hypothetical protein n=1 Tax=Nannocystis sp. TaxID=1962667 RepID=UPI0025F39DAB|nr:hypothetical protein [Nannocystis sp.]MBK7829968.1 hypothetical protein [Nannocystis sp.]
MKPCTRCHRHVRRAAAACPFCGEALLELPAPAIAATLAACAPWALGLAVFAACGGKDDGDTDSTSTSEASTSTGEATTTAAPTTSATDAASTGCLTGCSDTTVGTGFIYGTPDTGDTPSRCDVQAEDCPAGEKCMPWVDGGGAMWNALKCVPVDPTPWPSASPARPRRRPHGRRQLRQARDVLRGPGNTGVCRAMCDSGTCEAGFNCFIGNDNVLQLRPRLRPQHARLPARPHLPAGGRRRRVCPRRLICPSSGPSSPAPRC